MARFDQIMALALVESGINCAVVSRFVLLILT